MAIKVNKSDFLVVTFGPKNLFVKVLKITEATIRVVDAASKNTNDTFEVFPEDVKANLGRKPIKTKLFGVSTECFVKEYDDKYLKSDIALMAFLPKEIKDLPEDAVKIISKLVKTNNLAGLLPLNIKLDYDPKSNMGGYYKPSNKEPDILSINLAHCNTKESINQIAAHELGHGIWHRLMNNNQLRVQWIIEYLEYFQVNVMDKKDYKKLRNDFIKSKMTIKDYSKTIEDVETKELFNLAIKEIGKIHRLKGPHINALNTFMSEDAEQQVRKLWPPFPVILVRVQENNVSKYAEKNCEEFFCEVLSNHLNDVKNPKHLQKLITKTLAQASSSKRREFDELEPE